MISKELDPTQVRKLSQAAPEASQVEKAAKDFESVLIYKVLEQMRKTVPDSGLLEESGREQTESIFYMQLSQELGKQGGLGLWKQLAAQMKSHTAASSKLEGRL